VTAGDVARIGPPRIVEIYGEVRSAARSPRVSLDGQRCFLIAHACHRIGNAQDGRAGSPLHPLGAVGRAFDNGPTSIESDQLPAIDGPQQAGANGDV
jgi:hypothetical protein